MPYQQNVLMSLLTLSLLIPFAAWAAMDQDGNQLATPFFTDEQIGNIYINENFGSDGFSGSWYDNIDVAVNPQEGAIRSGALEYRYLENSEYPLSGTISRHAIPATDQVYLRYYIKYSNNWVGSNLPYHPHEFYLLTNKDSDWQGPGVSRLTIYFEQNAGQYRVGLQDSSNIDHSRIGSDLSDVSESRAVAGCNGSLDGVVGDCYNAGSSSRNGKVYHATDGYLFRGSAGLSQWHLVEAFVKLNRISDNKGADNGEVMVWINGEIVLKLDNVLFRTQQHVDMMFDQFSIGPYIGGGGSPIAQSFWVDDLIVASGPASPVEFISPPRPPSNLAADKKAPI